MKTKLWLVAAALACGTVQATEMDWDSYVAQRLSSNGAYFKQQAQLTRVPSREMSMVLLAARQHWDQLSPATQTLAQRWFPRPDASGGDPYVTLNPNCENAIRTTHFAIHFIDPTWGSTCSSDANAAKGPYVQALATAAETAWSTEHTALGYLREKSDGTAGGDARYDIYLANIGSLGMYGYTVPEQNAAVSTSYIVMDNDMSTTEFPFGTSLVDAAKTTISHEYFHAIQIGAYDATENVTWMEQTATWIEGLVFPGVPAVGHNQNFEYLGDSFNDLDDNEVFDSGIDTFILDVNGNGLRDSGSMDFPTQPLDAFSPTVDFTIQYGRFVWPQYLSEKFGNIIVKEIWDQCAAVKGDNIFTATQAVLSTLHASSLSAAYQEYATWNYDVANYASGAYFPHAWVDDIVSPTVDYGSNVAPTLVGASLPHLSSIYIRIDNPSGQYDFASTGLSALSVIEYSGGVPTTTDVTLTAGAGSWTAAGGSKAIVVVSNTSATSDCMYWSLVSNGTTPSYTPRACAGGSGANGGTLYRPGSTGGGGALDLLALAIAGLFAARRRFG